MKYKVVFWESEYEREEGISNIAERGLSLEDAKRKAVSLVDLNCYECSEVREENENEKAVYTYDGEK